MHLFCPCPLQGTGAGFGGCAGGDNIIQQLPIEFREIIILREYEELSYSEIANVLQCPMGTVMSRLARARSRLGDLLSISRETLPTDDERTVDQ